MKQKVRGVGVGTVSLVLIFAVLCLTVFAMLTLSTSNAEKALADRTASFVTGYYEADSRATQIRAQVLDSYRTGAFPDVIDDVEIAYEQSDNGIFVTYSCEVNEVQALSIKLKLERNTDIVLEWKTVYAQDWEIDDNITVWDFDDFF